MTDAAGSFGRSATLPDRRRVLFLVGQLGYGGSEGQLRLLTQHLDPVVWESHVLVFHPSPNADYVNEMSADGIGVSVMPRTAVGPLGKLKYATRIARQIRPHVVHSWTVHDNPYAAWAGIRCRAPVRWGSLRGSTSLPGFSSLPRWYRILALRSVQRVVVNSESLTEELRLFGLGTKRILVLPNCVGAEPAVRREMAPDVLGEFGFRAEHRVFGSVGNIRQAKNQALFVRALARVIAEHPEARGLIIGETLAGEESTRAELEREIDSFGLQGKIILTRFRADVRQLMVGMAALCMTSASEGMPNVVLEAMAEGVPVIATAVGGVPEVVYNGSTGFLAAPGDEAGVVKAMARVLEDPDEARRLAAAARELVVQERSCAAIARQLETAYLEAIRLAGAP